MLFRSPWPDIELPACSISDVILGVAARNANKSFDLCLRPTFRANRRRSFRRAHAIGTHEVLTEVDVRPRNVVVLGPGVIPKTPSGKLRRADALSPVT